MVDERPRVGRQSAHRAADVLVDLRDLFDARRDQQRARDALLGREHDALPGAHADGGGAELLSDELVGGERRKRERERRKDKETRWSIGQSMPTETLSLLIYLDSLDRVLDLEQPPLGAKGVDPSVVLGPGEEHRVRGEGGGEREGIERAALETSEVKKKMLDFTTSSSLAFPFSL